MQACIWWPFHPQRLYESPLIGLHWRLSVLITMQSTPTCLPQDKWSACTLQAVRKAHSVLANERPKIIAAFAPDKKVRNFVSRALIERFTDLSPVHLLA